MSKHPLPESRGVVHDLQAVIRRRPLAQVLHTDPHAFPAASREQYLAIVVAGLPRLGLNDEKAELARVGAAREVRHRHCVAVIPARARGLRRVGVD